MNASTSKWTYAWIASMAVALVAACGGGGDSGPTGSSKAVYGVAAVGAALANAKIDLTDAVGTKLRSTTASDTGTYTIATDGLTLPLMLRAQKPNGDFIYSIADNNGPVNINPLTNLVVAKMAQRWASINDPNALFTSFSSHAFSLKGKVSAAVGAVFDVDLPSEFKTKAGTNYDIFDPNYVVGNSLDKAFDAYNLVYDEASGATQVKPIVSGDLKTFGHAAHVSASEPVGVAGIYTGSVTINNVSESVWAHLDTSGKLLLYVPQAAVFFGKISGAQPTPPTLSASFAGTSYSLANGDLVSSTAAETVALTASAPTPATSSPKRSGAMTVDVTLSYTGAMSPVTPSSSPVLGNVFPSAAAGSNALSVISFGALSSPFPTLPASSAATAAGHLNGTVTETGAPSASFVGTFTGTVTAYLSTTLKFEWANCTAPGDTTKTCVTVAATNPPAGFPGSLTLQPNNTLTYGRNLGASNSFAGKTLGGIRLPSASTAPKAGIALGYTYTESATSNASAYFSAASLTNCKVTRNHVLKFVDLEHSMYQLQTTEIIQNSGSSGTCAAATASSGVTMVGDAAFTSDGLLVFYVDADNRNNVQQQYDLVAVKLLTQ